MTDIGKRKADHLDLATKGDVGFLKATTLFECVRLVHDALPELDYSELDTSVELFGKRLSAPLLIAGMTGGTERAERINHELAAVAEERGYAFGLGSQRAMLKNPKTLATYAVRERAPRALVFGNLGVVQAAKLETSAIDELVKLVQADAICIHLNPAMELVQREGDRDFRGGLATLERLSRELSVPVIAKETGSGISSGTAARVRKTGVRHVDVSGAGGTSWVAVEMHRAEGVARGVGETFRDWGVPTAASVALCARHGFETVIATGGIGNGLDVAKAVALGASLAGIARSSLQALESGGKAAVFALFDRIEAELKTAMLLVGAKNLAALRSAPRIVNGELAEWLDQT
jgi:isopentenyl-diphosphate delta-isomerase